MTDGAAPAGPSRAGRSGRRPGRSAAREEILAAARRRFAEDGFEATGIRTIAADAGVDPALVMYYFRSKDGLFAAAVGWPVDLAEIAGAVLAPGVEGLGERLVRLLLRQWETENDRQSLRLIVRNATSHGPAARLLTEFVQTELVGRLVTLVDDPSAELRGTLVCGALVGLAMARYVIAVEPLASAPAETVVAAVGPTIQRYLVGSIEGP
jgi:AcrR family transcriptional regulator